ncbi:MAG: type IVB secretion system protein IcmH/DotU [Chitinispirillaceae bacterium]|nr:type IVB secretion system protein IcmH/DotU [Chitinispirillaceae bacterium]
MGTFVDTITSQTMNLDLTKTLGGARDLQGLCTDLFLIVIRMREAEDLGDPASLRKLIGYYLELFEKNCKSIGIPADSVLEAKYALVALIDETVLSVPGICRDYWFTRPLQLDLFGDNIAGEEFYNKLQKMLLETEKKKDALEIYYICLSLGFEGRYKLFNAEERVTIMDELGRKIRRTRIRSSAGISPHGGRTDSIRRRKSSGFLFPIWLAAVLIVGGIAALYSFLFLLSTAQAAGIMDFLGKLTFK